MSQQTSKAHVLGAVLSARAPDAQLAIAVVAPALKGAPGHDRARVRFSQGDEVGKIAWIQQFRVCYVSFIA